MNKPYKACCFQLAQGEQLAAQFGWVYIDVEADSPFKRINGMIDTLPRKR